MRGKGSPARLLVMGFLLLVAVCPASAQLDLGPQELVQAGGSEIVVPGYSVPSFAHWDGDLLPDLIVGEGSGSFPDGKVRIYLNIGTPEKPLFGEFFYAQSLGSDLIVPGSW